MAEHNTYRGYILGIINRHFHSTFCPPESNIQPTSLPENSLQALLCEQLSEVMVPQFNNCMNYRKGERLTLVLICVFNEQLDLLRQ